MKDLSVVAAAYHEAAHAVIAVTQGLPLRRKGIHIDTLGEGITYILQREPGNPANGARDLEERGRTILGLKAGFIKARLMQRNLSPTYAADDDLKVQTLLRESYGTDEVKLPLEDGRLTGEARNLVNEHWPIIEAVAKALLQQPITPKLPGNRPESLWKSPDDQKQSLSGLEVADIMRPFGLGAKVDDR